MNADEPSYLAFARANNRQGFPSGPIVVRELVDRIDRDASALKAAQPRTFSTATELDSAPSGTVVREPLGLIWEKQGDGEGGTFWVETGDEREYKHTDIGLPAIVLWEPRP